VKNTVDAAEADLQILKDQIDQFEANRITLDSTVADMRKRFPDIAREIEQEIKNHEWAKDSLPR